MKTAEEDLSAWIEDVDGAATEEGARWSENFIKLVPRSQLDLKILEVGDSVRVMTGVKDKLGNDLVHKYTLLDRQIWQRLKLRADAPHIYFICEKPIPVVEGFNLEFFNYEDYQFLGAHLAESGRQKSARWLFNEALKCETADAFINKGVFHFRSESSGIFDSARLAQKHFERGLGLVHKMHLPPAEEKTRRRICQEALYEIEYRTVSGFIRFFKSILRILTLHTPYDIFYVGAADRKALKSGETLQLMTGDIQKYELQMMKEAAESFIYSLKVDLPAGLGDADLTLDGLAAQFGRASTEEQIVDCTDALGSLYARVMEGRKDREKARDAVRKAEAVSILDGLSVEEKAELKRMDTLYSLKSPRELADMAEQKDIKRQLWLWLYKERAHVKVILETLYQNKAVPEELKKEIERRFGLGSKPQHS